MNPILPREFFVPDSEAHVMPDGRLYIYGSLDISGSPDYCSKELRCFSTDDMEHWVDHGVIFRNDKESAGVPWSPDMALYAPDAIYKDGKYYLFVCGPNGYEGVAVGDSPIGPFRRPNPSSEPTGTALIPPSLWMMTARPIISGGSFICGGECWPTI